MGDISIFQKMKQGLQKTRSGPLAALFAGRGELDAEFYEELEEALIMADVGISFTTLLLNGLQEEVKKQKIRTSEEARGALASLICSHMRSGDDFLEEDGGVAALLVVGVNGVGKTTSIGKLANYYKEQGRKPMLAAADTFRAAAAEQLGIWAERAGVPMVKHTEGADPAAVVFDAIASGRAKGCNLLICDTAGRLHNKKNLMNELEKIRRVIARELPEAPCRVMLVLDATTGQNGILQARAFMESAGVTDIVLTKLDGTAKGGVVLAIQHELKLPVRFVGVGEAMDDLQPFDPEAFAAALL